MGVDACGGGMWGVVRVGRGCWMVLVLAGHQDNRSPRHPATRPPRMVRGKEQAGHGHDPYAPNGDGYPGKCARTVQGGKATSGVTRGAMWMMAGSAHMHGWARVL